jgi:hypothetical protein
MDRKSTSRRSGEHSELSRSGHLSAVLTKNECPEDLRKFWLGQVNPDISDEYAEQLLEDIERRQEVAARIGLGFEIPEPSFVPNVPKTPELEAVAVEA